MGRIAGSRLASIGTHLIPLSLMAWTRLGLSTGCCGRIRSPEYSPGASSSGSIGMPLALAHWMLFVISPLIVL